MLPWTTIIEEFTRKQFGNNYLVVQEVVGVKEQVEILGGLCQEEALHPVSQAVVSYILYSCITTGSSGGGRHECQSVVTFSKDLVEC